MPLDYYHTDYLTLLERMLAPGGTPEVASDNNLIQGKNSFDCATVEAGDVTPCVADAPRAVFTFVPGKVHRLRLMNTGSEGVQHFSIDDHTLTVIAYDFVPIVAYDTQVVTLGVGQRADVLVTADAANGTSFWMRSNIAGCSAAKQPYAQAVVYYGSSDADGTDTTRRLAVRAAGGDGAGCHVGRGWRPSEDGAAYGGAFSRARSSSSSSSSRAARPEPTSSPWPAADASSSSACANDALSATQPLYPMALPAASWTHTFEIGMFVNASDVTLWTFDGVSFRGDYNAPTLLLASLGNTTRSWPRAWNARDLYANSSVRMVINNGGPSEHPMHLHGSNFFVLHEGPGRWDGHSVVNAANPMRRDVEMVRAGGHLVLQFDSTNAGVWAFHCHIAWHASGGFFTQFVVQPEQIEQMQVPSIMAQTCRDWAAWTGTHVPDQIDSGL